MAKVYVSSTFADLQEERRAVFDWLQAARHQIVDSYLPNSETLRDGFLHDLDTCDLYVLILGHHYGFQVQEDNPEGLSITHLEFRRAGRSGIPRIALLRTTIPDVSLSDIADPQKAAMVQAFRAEVTDTVRSAEFRDERSLIQVLSTGIQGELEKRSTTVSGAGLTQGIFLSYRREDAAPYARLLQRELKERFPDARVFMDLDSIEAGLDFAELIGRAVDSCAVLVALIGRQWVTLTDREGHRRLDNPDDYVCFEVQRALERGVRVIPVLVDGANPPGQQELPFELRKLARLNAHKLSYGSYQYDADQLFGLIQRVLVEVRDRAGHSARQDADHDALEETARVQAEPKARLEVDRNGLNAAGPKARSADLKAGEERTKSAEEEAPAARAFDKIEPNDAEEPLNEHSPSDASTRVGLTSNRDKNRTSSPYNILAATATALQADFRTGIHNGIATCGWSQYLGDRVPPSAIGTSYGLRTALALDLRSPEINYSAIVKSLLRLQRPGGGWAASTQRGIGRPEVTAWVLGAASRAGMDHDEKKELVHLLERMTTFDDPIALNRTTVMATIVSTLTDVEPTSERLPVLSERIARGCSAVNSDRTLVAWGEVLQEGSKPSIPHSARAVIALGKAAKVVRGIPGLNATADAGRNWLSQNSVELLDTDEQLRRPVGDGDVDALFIGHFTAAWTARALLTSEEPHAHQVALRRALRIVIDSQRQGIWRWHDDSTPIWMTYQGISVVRDYILKGLMWPP